VTERSGLVAAVCAVMDEVGMVAKGGYNEQQRYRYASDVDLLKALQPAMASHGLMMAPCDIVHGEAHEKATKKGGTMIVRTVTVSYELRHVSGESMVVMTAGEGMDSGDKSLYKALTGAYKYALRQTFAIPTGDDAEVDSPERGKAPKHAPKHAPKAKAPKAKTPSCSTCGRNDIGLSRGRDGAWYCADHGDKPVADTTAVVGGSQASPAAVPDSWAAEIEAAAESATPGVALLAQLGAIHQTTPPERRFGALKLWLAAMGKNGTVDELRTAYAVVKAWPKKAAGRDFAMTELAAAGTQLAKAVDA